jgi:transcriptional regulator GlxA family with amidase domain
MILFFLVPNFSMIAFATAIEPLRLANRFHTTQAYEWRLISIDGAPVKASNGLSINVDMSLAEIVNDRSGILKPDIALVCSGLTIEQYQEPKLFAWLRHIHGHGVTVGGLCTGAWVLAEVGLLEKYRCAIHWENLPGFIEKFPNIDVHSNLFEMDRNIYTCAGGTASLDMMLHIISGQLGDDIVTKVCEQCLADKVRNADDRQRLPLRARRTLNNKKLLYIIEQMEENISEPLQLEEISALTSLSRRHIERMFRQYLGQSLARFYLELRLEYAHHLLMQSDLHIIDVAVACGFVSASHFSKCYRNLYQLSPRADRIAAAAPMEAPQLAAH